MIEFTAWMQSIGIELGTLFAEFVFLAAGIWFARNILKPEVVPRSRSHAPKAVGYRRGCGPASANSAGERPFQAQAAYCLRL